MGAMVMGAIFTANAQQVVFEENWDGTGPGIEGWTLYDEDGNEVYMDDPLSALITDAWNILSLDDIQGAIAGFEYPEDATGMEGNVAASTSWYTTVQTSNDWLVTPAIVISPDLENVELNWAANSMGNPTYLEDYEVMISTTDNAVGSFEQLLNVPNELNTGNYRTVSLEEYIGETVYIAFRNIGSDQYVMLLDNITVTADGAAGINDVLASKFSVYPNPANNVINLTNAENILVSGVVITDLNGRTVKNVAFDGVVSAQISVADLSAGMYMMTVSSDKGTMTKKIVKN